MLDDGPARVRFAFSPLGRQINLRGPLCHRVPVEVGRQSLAGGHGPTLRGVGIVEYRSYRLGKCGDVARRRAVAARERLTSDFDWHTVAQRTAQVYLAAKRREREPHPRRPIVEHPLPER